ncbi:ribonuclease H-like domain-containing protein [Tanacetum coccineum]
MASRDQQWYMDTGATTHLSSHIGNLHTSSLNRNFHSIIVENRSSIPVTHSGHVQIPNPYRLPHLRNVLVTPNIIKNLVLVRKFTTDNKCSIDFDPYGFTVRDYHTRQTLIRCDSTGDLYPLHVAASAFALLTNNHSLWHQRLGHPGDAVIHTLSSRGLVSYNKQNTQHLCRACQLGKQTKLSFQRSTTIVTSPPDIIHSDLWTSPVSSLSGYKYYVLFLDHYSYFLWVYPLYRKYDAQSKLLHFRAFVKTQFNREIKAFQCDHGGEFDNNSLHELFATNGIQFRFSCPRTSQQNGKSERMIRTINNVVRSLLFQARLPPEYWVEALLTAAYLLNIIPSTSINNDIPYTKIKYATDILEQVQMLKCNPCMTPIDTEKKLGPEGSPVTDPTLYRNLARSLHYFGLLHHSLLHTLMLIGQDTLSRSSAEAEYRGVANVVAETSWIHNLLRKLHTLLFTAILVYYDNVSDVYMSANPVQHQCTKHIEIDIHFVRDKVAAGHVRVLHVSSRFQYADIFTKGLPYPLFTDFRSSLSVRKTSAPTAGAY